MEPVLDIRVLTDLLTRLASILRAVAETQLLISLDEVYDFWDELDSDDDPNPLLLSFELQRSYSKFTAELVQSIVRDLLQPSPAIGSVMILMRSATESLARLRHISTPIGSLLDCAKKAAKMLIDDESQIEEAIAPGDAVTARYFSSMEAWLEDRGIQDRARYGHKYAAKIENLIPGLGRSFYKKGAGFSHGNSVIIGSYAGVGLRRYLPDWNDEADSVDTYERRQLDIWIAGILLAGCLLDAVGHIIDSAHMRKGFDDSWRDQNDDLVSRVIRDMEWHIEVLVAYTQTAELVHLSLKAYLKSRSADEIGGHLGEMDEQGRGA